jgi:hypothetical protein
MQQQQQQHQANGGPGLGQGQAQASNAQALIDNFPMLWAMKLQGKLAPDQEKLVSRRRI